MLIEDKSVLAAEQNERLSDPVRYLAVRLAELLDPGSHFSHSGNERLDPIHLLAELVIAAQGFLENDGTRRETMQEALARTRSLLKGTRHLQAWYGAERQAVLNDLTVASQPPGAGHQSETQLRNYVKTKTGALLRGSLAALAHSLNDPNTGYRRRLLETIEDAITEASFDDARWRDFDDDLADLAGLLLGEGRDGAQLARDLASRLADADSDAEALASLKEIVCSAAETFRVGFILHGTKQVANAAAFNCTVVAPNDAEWGTTTLRDPKPRDSLRRFLRRRTDKRRACGVIVEVQALDPFHARALAMSQAEELRDQLAAEHRLNTFRIDEDVIVLEASTGMITPLVHRPSGVKAGRTLTRQPIPELQHALRYHALAQRESAPVVSVLHSWIALESLAVGGKVMTPSGPKYQGAGSFLPPHLGAVIKMTSVRQLLTRSWWIARNRARQSSHRAEWEELGRWLGVQGPGGQVDIDRWKDLLLAEPSGDVPDSLGPGTTVDEAASWLELLAPEFGVFADRRIRMVRWLLAKGDRLVNHISKLGQRAEAHASRMNWLRNKAVHNAMIHAPSAQQLARTAYDIGDAVFEVIPHWLPGTNATWEALKAFRGRASQNMSNWRNPCPAAITCSKLIEP